MPTNSSTIYGPSTLGTPSNNITFNNRGQYPYFRLKARQPAKFQMKEYNIDLPDQEGIADWQTLVGQVTYILSGIMYPINETTYDTGRQQLLNLGSLDIEQADPNSDFGYVPYTWVQADGTTRYIMMKVEYVNIPESTTNGLKLPFQIVAKVKYPVIYGATQAGTMSVGVSSLNVGGAVIPSRIPMQIGSSLSSTTSLPFTLPVILGATSQSGGITLNNPGSLQAFPTFTITGPISTPTITYGATGQFITLNTTIQAGQSAIITYTQDEGPTITVNNQTALSALTTSSTLFKIRPGTAQFTLTGASVSSGAGMTVSFNPLWPLA